MRVLAFLVSIVVAGAACGSIHVLPDAEVDGSGELVDAGANDGADASSCDDRACNATQPDSCCPSGCDADTDLDCAAICGNGVLEPGERCDPLGSCPTACPASGCSRARLDQAGTCFARCMPDGEVSACSNGDGCCPAGCNAVNDTDCSPSCGNGVREGIETCDPLTSCPATCPPQGCQLRALRGGGTCTAQCVAAGTQTACAGGDQCCPSGCNTTTDSDCAAGCGNGVIEAGETCDPIGTCPTSCPSQGCQLRTLTGAGTCSAACAPAGTQTACINGDGCCPGGCTAATDSDCAPVCGNNVVEPGETCDGNCSCTASNPCYTTTGSAATCDLRCQQPIRTCSSGDACCAFDGSGGCGASSDSSCAGPGWAFAQWRDVQYGVGNNCDVMRVGIHPQGWYVFTTCSPSGGGTGDPRVTQVTDNLGNISAVTNDDCLDLGALPRLAGWQCANTEGAVRHFCASSTPGGFRPEPNATYLDVIVCPYNDPGAGSAPFFIWYNAPQVPGMPIGPI